MKLMLPFTVVSRIDLEPSVHTHILSLRLRSDQSLGMRDTTWQRKTVTAASIPIEHISRHHEISSKCCSNFSGSLAQRIGGLSGCRNDRAAGFHGP